MKANHPTTPLHTLDKPRILISHQIHTSSFIIPFLRDWNPRNWSDLHGWLRYSLRPMSRWRNAIGVATCAMSQICFAWPWAHLERYEYMYIIYIIYIKNIYTGTHGRHKYYDMKCKPKLQARFASKSGLIFSQDFWGTHVNPRSLSQVVYILI